MSQNPEILADVLLIDDDTEFSSLFSDVLSSEGFRVQHVSNGNDALKLLKTSIFEIILLDLELPDIRGEKLLKKIVKVVPSSKIIVITGNPTPDSAMDTFREGIVDYIKKPFEFNEIIQIIKENLSMVYEGDVLGSIGRRLRKIRQLKKITIKQLSGKANLTEALISMIENGKNSPSLTTISKLANALNVPVASFFEFEEEGFFQITRRNERIKVFNNKSRASYEYLIKNYHNTRMKPFLSKLSPSTSFACVPQTRKGEMIGFLVSGILEVEIGKEKFVLREGESVVFNGSIPHIWENIGKDEAVSIWIVYNE